MSDAPAAPVTENGVPPVAQDTVEETPGFKVFAGNLAYSTTDDGLKTFFAPVKDDILSAQVILRGSRSAGYGFVSLNSIEAAQKAVDLLDNKELDGRQVIVQIAKPVGQKEPKERRFRRKAGRRGSRAVPGELTEAEANGEAVKVEDSDAPAAGDGAKPKKTKKKSRKSKRRTPAANGDVEGEVVATGGEVVLASDAPAAEGEATKKPRVRKPRAPRPLRPAGEEPTGEPSKTMLFVANLGFTISDEELAAIFSEVDITVNSARIVRRRWGKPRRSKGYGFVDVGSEEQQQKAIELLQGKEIGGRPIAVKVAVNSQQEEIDATAPVTEAVPETTAPVN